MNCGRGCHLDASAITLLEARSHAEAHLKRQRRQSGGGRAVLHRLTRARRCAPVVAALASGGVSEVFVTMTAVTARPKRDLGGKSCQSSIQLDVNASCLSAEPLPWIPECGCDCDSLRTWSSAVLTAFAQPILDDGKTEKKGRKYARE